MAVAGTSANDPRLTWDTAGKTALAGAVIPGAVGGLYAVGRSASGGGGSPATVAWKTAAIGGLIAGEAGLLHNNFQRPKDELDGVKTGAGLGVAALGLTVPAVRGILNPDAVLSRRGLGTAVSLIGIGLVAGGVVGGIAGWQSTKKSEGKENDSCR